MDVITLVQYSWIITSLQYIHCWNKLTVNTSELSYLTQNPWEQLQNFRTVRKSNERIDELTCKVLLMPSMTDMGDSGLRTQICWVSR